MSPQITGATLINFDMDSCKNYMRPIYTTFSSTSRQLKCMYRGIRARQLNALKISKGKL